MDESFMSVGCDDQFDDDSFIESALSTSVTNSSIELTNTSTTIDISSLINEPKVADLTTKCRLDFNETPRNSSTIRERKRKKFARRCLSNNDFSFNNSEDDHMSFQEFRHSKEQKTSHNTFKSPDSTLESIENTFVSPKSVSKENDSVIDLTPEFNVVSKKSSNNEENNETLGRARKPLKSSSNLNRAAVPLQKYFSENHASIMRAVQVSSDDPSLIGDFSKGYVLPLLKNSKHQDLKSISCHVLANLLQGQYSDVIERFTIIDCRYPYEYSGGHIRSSLNLYTQDQILAQFIRPKANQAEADTNTNIKRDILIFHCEFSSERGPSLCRFLRNNDRVKNRGVYPNLHYPELYLLEGGYKDFYFNYSYLCEPQSYLPMHAKEHEEDLRKFRSICKSFDAKHTTQKRNFRL